MWQFGNPPSTTDRWLDYATAELPFAEAMTDELIGVPLDPEEPTTTDVASHIAASLRALGRQGVWQERVFPVGRQPVQGAQRGIGPGAIRPDVSFPAADGSRVNLEVDRSATGSRRHREEHWRAMQALLLHLGPARARELIEGTRSVFLRTDRQGRVIGMERVGYQLVDGRLRRIRQRARLAGPTTPQELLRAGLLDAAAAAGRVSPAAGRPGSRGLRLRRRARADRFVDY
jgi:hypothetical protein